MTDLPFNRVEIDGFRSLRSLRLNNLGRVNVFVGDNSAGKTSVLEAIAILCRPHNPTEWLDMMLRRDSNGLRNDQFGSLHWCFTRSSSIASESLLTSEACTLKCQGNFPLRELQVKASYSGAHINGAFKLPSAGTAELIYEPTWSVPVEADHRLTSQVIKKSAVLFKSQKNNEGIRSVTLSSPATEWLDSKSLTPYSFKTERVSNESLFQLFLSGRISKVIDLLQCFDADIKGIDGIDATAFDGRRTEIIIKHRTLGLAPLSAFGDGMRRALHLALTISRLEAGGALLIDDIDVGIHTAILGKVFKWLTKSAQQENIQLFVTTHSLEAIDAIIASDAKQEKEDVVVYRLNQAEEETCARRFSGHVLHRLRWVRGIDIRQSAASLSGADNNE